MRSWTTEVRSQLWTYSRMQSPSGYRPWAAGRRSPSSGPGCVARLAAETCKRSSAEVIISVKELRPVATVIDPQGNDVTPLSWEEAQARIDAARWYWLTTLHPSGRPHTRPVRAVWTSGALCSTSTRAAQKGRDLRRDPRCSVAITADDMHIVLESTASPMGSGPMLDRVAEAHRSKYNWPVTVVEGGF